MDMSKARRLASLITEKREIEAWLKETKEAIQDLEADLLEEMAEEGVDRLTVDGLTLYPRREVYPSPIDPEAAITALRSHGLDDFIETRVNTNRLRSWWSEHEAEDTIPEDVAAVFNPNERYRIGATKASRK